MYEPITDWFTPAGAEFLTTGTNREVRLDHIMSVKEL
jgi:hypothetical protein